jgi:hypothetical protein
MKTNTYIQENIKLVVKTKEGEKFAHVYKGDDKMPLKGTNFPLNTPMKEILRWANAPTNQNIF